MEVSAYIMRVGKNGEAYQGYLGEADVSLLEQGYIYPLGGGLAVVCVEDAVVQGETLNRAVYDGGGNFQTVLAGDLAAVRYEGGCFKDVYKEDIASIENALKPVGRIAYGKVCLKASSMLHLAEDAGSDIDALQLQPGNDFRGFHAALFPEPADV